MRIRRNSSDSGKYVRMENGRMQVAISRENGNLEAICFKRRKFGKWNAAAGNLAIVDGISGLVYSSDSGSCDLSQRVVRGSQITTVENTRKFKKADFVVREIWTLQREFLSWRIEIKLRPGQKEHAVAIRQMFPYPDSAWGTKVWSAQAQFPTTVARLGGLHLAYGDICYGTAIPAVTFFDEAKDAGVTLTKPFGLKTAFLSFNFDDYRGRGMEIETSMLGLKSGKTAVTEFLIHPHEGCWRPGLAWLCRKYPDYFEPPNPRVRSLEGGYLFGHPFMKETEIASVVPFGVRWEELHVHHPYYGEYAPQAEEWPNISEALNLEKDYPEFKGSAGKVSGPIVEKHIRLAHKHGIKSLPYFQCAGDGDMVHVVPRFPDAAARDEFGRPFVNPWRCCLMNAAPETSFGKEMLCMIDRFCEKYPSMDGVFLDQLCYDALDMAHDDGVTMKGGRYGYRLWHCYEKPLEKLAGRIHESGKVIFSNVAYNVEVQRNIDAHMAETLESLDWTPDVLQYVCVYKPLLLLAYYKNARQLEMMLQKCLLCGASSYSVFPNPEGKQRKIFRAYIPLVEKLRGRKWLLSPRPLEIPYEYSGNIFSGENGNILVTLVDKGASILSQVGRGVSVTVRTRFKGMNRIKRAKSFGVHYAGGREAKIKKEKNGIAVTIPDHCVATVVSLEF